MLYKGTNMEDALWLIPSLLGDWEIGTAFSCKVQSGDWPYPQNT